MTFRTTMLALALLAPSLAAWSQSSQSYAGLEQRKIKALSEQQIGDLRAGRGMGLAMAAELNGHPGPAHVLELAEELGLTQQQKEQVRKLFDAMKGEAVPIGERLIAAEAGLDRAFATGTIGEAQLHDEVLAIADLEGELRFTHLKYHLAMMQLLTPGQVAHYNELRGYSAATPQGHSHTHRH